MVKIILVSTMADTGTLVPKPAWRLRITVEERSCVCELIDFYKSLHVGVGVSRSQAEPTGRAFLLSLQIAQ